MMFGSQVHSWQIVGEFSGILLCVLVQQHLCILPWESCSMISWECFYIFLLGHNSYIQYNTHSDTQFRIFLHVWYDIVSGIQLRTQYCIVFHICYTMQLDTQSCKTPNFFLGQQYDFHLSQFLLSTIFVSYPLDLLDIH